MTEPTPYGRLGGVFAIAAVVDHSSDAVVQNPIIGQKSENLALRERHTHNLGRLAGSEVQAHPVGVRSRVARALCRSPIHAPAAVRPASSRA